MSWQEFCESQKVPKKFRKCCLEHITEHNLVIERFIKNPTDSLILYGEPGRGKTYFLYSIIHTLLEKAKCPRHYIRFFSGVDLEDRIRKEVGEFKSSSHFVETLADAEFLFIDDFGVASMAEEAERHYYKLLDLRLNNELPTVISTNLDDADLLRMFGKRIQSRLKFCKRINFEGEDLRK